MCARLTSKSTNAGVRSKVFKDVVSNCGFRRSSAFMTPRCLSANFQASVDSLDFSSSAMVVFSSNASNPRLEVNLTLDARSKPGVDAREGWDNFIGVLFAVLLTAAALVAFIVWSAFPGDATSSRSCCFSAIFLETSSS